MSDIVQIIQECKCGHDKATHYRDSLGEGDCLAAHCDCAGFLDRHEDGQYQKQKRSLAKYVNKDDDNEWTP